MIGKARKFGGGGDDTKFGGGSDIGAASGEMLSPGGGDGGG